MIWSGLSPEAQKAKDEAAGRRRYWDRRNRDDRVFMARGPRLEGDWLVIPSNWYNEEAKDFWRSLGMRFDSGDLEKRWYRDTRRPHNGKSFDRWAWLKSARRKYYEFYPEVGNGNARW